MHVPPRFHVPDFDGGVKGCCCDRRLKALVGGAPPHLIHLLFVAFEGVHALVLVQRPYFARLVVRTRREELSRTPPDRVDFLLMALESLHWAILPHSAHVDQLVGRACRKAVVVPPVHIQSGP